MRLTAAVVACGLAACDVAPVEPTGAIDAGALDAGASTPDAGRDTTGLPYASEVVRFTPGASAGFGAERMPGVVLGPPQGKGTGAGSLDVVSLGVGGEVVLGTGELEIIDGPGPDLVVFENAFWANDMPQTVFAELGEVSVSTDAVSWRTFACAPILDERFEWPGCAGWTPAFAYDPFESVPLDPAVSGGDAFDLADVGLESARYVRVRDLSAAGVPPTAGFDLDAIGLVHARPAAP